VLQKRWGGATDPVVSAAAQNLTAAVLVAPVALVAGGRLEISAQLVLCLGWITLGLAVGTLLLYVHLLRRHAASTVTALLLLGAAGHRRRVGADARRGAAPGEPGRDARGAGRRECRARAREGYASPMV
jgi:hypothetical protein